MITTSGIELNREIATYYKMKLGMVKSEEELDDLLEQIEEYIQLANHQELKQLFYGIYARIHFDKKSLNTLYHKRHEVIEWGNDNYLLVNEETDRDLEINIYLLHMYYKNSIGLRGLRLDRLESFDYFYKAYKKATGREHYVGFHGKDGTGLGNGLKTINITHDNIFNYRSQDKPIDEEINSMLKEELSYVTLTGIIEWLMFGYKNTREDNIQQHLNVFEEGTLYRIAVGIQHFSVLLM